MSEMVEKVARAICLSTDADPDVMIGLHGKLPDWFFEAAKAAIKAMRELPENPGHRYTNGDYSRRNQEAMVDDALEQELKT